MPSIQRNQGHPDVGRTYWLSDGRAFRADPPIQTYECQGCGCYPMLERGFMGCARDRVGDPRRGLPMCSDRMGVHVAIFVEVDGTTGEPRKKSGRKWPKFLPD